MVHEVHKGILPASDTWPRPSPKAYTMSETAESKPHRSRKPPSLKRRVALLFDQNRSLSEIARIEGIDRETVARILADPETQQLKMEVPETRTEIRQPIIGDLPGRAPEQYEIAVRQSRLSAAERQPIPPPLPDERPHTPSPVVAARARTIQEWQELERRGGRRVVSSARMGLLAGRGIW